MQRIQIETGSYSGPAWVCDHCAAPSFADKNDYRAHLKIHASRKRAMRVLADWTAKLAALEVLREEIGRTRRVMRSWEVLSGSKKEGGYHEQKS